jgi:hypothetical protein
MWDTIIENNRHKNELFKLFENFGNYSYRINSFNDLLEYFMRAF